MNKLILSFGAALLAFPAFSATFTTTMAGSGTEADPYQVTSATHIQEMATATNATTSSARNNLAGVYFKMMNDVDLASLTDFLGIAQAPLTASSSNSTYTFNGVFDGNGFKIKNLKLVGVTFDDSGVVQSAGSKKSRQYVGLFGTLGATAKVSNLTIDASCSISGYNYVGSITGYAKTGAEITSCVNYAEVVGYNSNTGGISGYNQTNTMINKCTNYGTIEGRNQYVGGITSYADYLVTVSNCANYGKVSAWGQYVGGIVAKAYRTSSQTAPQIKRCYNAGSIYGNYSVGGGIVGTASLAVISECVNVGDVNLVYFNEKRTPGTQYDAGGILGTGDGNTITNCLNAGTITAEKELCGGITGSVKNNSADAGLISNCINIGSLICPSGATTGQIAAFNGSAASNKTFFENCYYDAQLGAQMSDLGCGGGSATGFTPLTTAELTSGKALAGLQMGVWKYTAGSYPVLFNFAAQPQLAAAATSYVMLPGATVACNFTSGEATISTAMSGITAKMAVGKYYTVANGKITATDAKAQVTDTIMLTNGTFSRPIPVGQMNIIWKGEGTQASPYLISTKQDMLTLADFCNTGHTQSFTGTYFKLANDIDMENDSTFHGIGLGSVSNAYKYFLFNGIFDGDNHIISHIETPNITPAAYSHGGLFGVLGGDARIMNVHLDSTCYISGKGVGSIAGRANAGVQIINCSSAATIEAKESFAGGIVGDIYAVEGDSSIVSKCLFSGKIKSCRDQVGGIAGFTKARIEDCVNLADVILPGYKDITSSTYKTYGGIVGSNYGIVNRCANYGNVAGTNCVGGISGLVGSTYGGGFTYNSINTGVVLANDTTKSGAVIGSTGSSTTVYALSGVYYDKQLSIQKAMNDTLNPVGTHPMLTSDLTNGLPLDSLTGFTFTKGYYPIPTVFANNELVKQAAATFFVLPADQSIAGGVKRGEINTAMKVKGTMDTKGVFTISENRVMADNVSIATLAYLTLKCGDFSKTYPILNPGGVTCVNGLDANDPIVETIYYDMLGRRIINPAKGTIANAVYTTASGKKVAAKVILK